MGINYFVFSILSKSVNLLFHDHFISRSAHPYLFFNEDGETMTFLGVNIGERGQLIDPASETVIEEGFISTDLKRGLETQGVDLSCGDFNSLER